MLNVHPSLLPRWRGAAPIERAIMAGDERTGVCVMRLTEGLDSGPVALREEVAIGAEDDFESALGAGSRRSAASCWSGALDLLAEGRARASTSRTTTRRPTPRRSTPAERRLDPARPAAELARDGPRADPARRRLPGDRRAASGSACGGRAPVDVGVTAGRAARRVGGAAARLRRRARCGSRSCSRPAASRWRPTPTCAATRCRSAVSGGSPPARAARLRDVRATFEEDAFTERAFREAADGAALDGRERAQAQRLAYGAVQRRGTTDAAIERLAERSPRLLDPPVIAALRLGLYELLFADATPDHAAVDQAVELVKRRRRRPRLRPRQRGPAPRRPASATALTAVAARRRLDPGARRGRPLGAALAGADVVGGARRRGRRARCSPPATSRPEVAFRVEHPAHRRARPCSPALREAGRRGRAARRCGRVAAGAAGDRSSSRGGPGRRSRRGSRPAS